MKKVQGKGVGGGICFGRLYYLKRGAHRVVRRHIDNPETEWHRLLTAKEQALGELGHLYQKALPEVGEQGAALFEIHQMMLEDEDYCDAIKGIIDIQKVNAEYAVTITGENFARMFSEMEDPYMRERAADVKDVSDRLVHCLCGTTGRGIDSDEPVIIAAQDLSPSETIQLDKSKILAFVTAAGSTNSHTAILARTMGIPAIVGIGDALLEEWDGLHTAVDGSTGELFIEPDAQNLARLQQKKQEEQNRKALLEEYKGRKNRTLDGQEILVYANIGSPSELSIALQNDAGGIGLFRSEFLYLESAEAPTEEQQFEAYKIVAQTMAGKRVIFRTLDVGADKQIAYFNLPVEENPALGLRGARLCIERPDIIKTQLRALYRASAFGKIAIMFPMITSVWEVRALKEIAAQARVEISAQGITFDSQVELGIMVETPAAALISDRLAPEVDFLSIGTNDLTQYTLAVDRQNNNLDRFCDPHHEAVLRLIRMAAENAHKAGIWIGICGELAADLTLTKEFLKMGIDELSVSPSAILGLRKKICETTVYER